MRGDPTGGSHESRSRHVLVRRPAGRDAARGARAGTLSSARARTSPRRHRCGARSAVAHRRRGGRGFGRVTRTVDRALGRGAGCDDAAGRHDPAGRRWHPRRARLPERGRQRWHGRTARIRATTRTRTHRPPTPRRSSAACLAQAADHARTTRSRPSQRASASSSPSTPAFVSGVNGASSWTASTRSTPASRSAVASTLPTSASPWRTGKREVAPAPLLLRLVHLERVLEVEQVQRASPVVAQPIERRQEGGSTFEALGGRIRVEAPDALRAVDRYRHCPPRRRTSAARSRARAASARRAADEPPRPGAP